MAPRKVPAVIKNKPRIRYWGWDPKETWALISIVVYALVLHIRFIPLLKGIMNTFSNACVQREPKQAQRTNPLPISITVNLPPAFVISGLPLKMPCF